MMSGRVEDALGPSFENLLLTEIHSEQLLDPRDNLVELESLPLELNHSASAGALESGWRVGLKLARLGGSEGL